MGNPRPSGHIRPIVLGTVAVAVAWSFWRWLDEWTASFSWDDEMSSGPRTDALETWEEIRWYGPATET